MEMTDNIFTGKTVEEAVEAGLKTMGLTAEQAEITVIEEGKRKLIGSVRAKVRIERKASDGERATSFIDGLMKIMRIPAFTEVVSDDERIEIEIKTTNTSAVIGRRGEVLDAIQGVASAVANIGREEYRRVVVDCENYRRTREEKLKTLAAAKAKKAVERKRRVALEPMSPYERRVVHSVLAENEEVTTISEGREPARRVVIVPKNEEPHARKGNSERRGGRQFNRDKRAFGGERRDSKPGRDRYRGERGEVEKRDRSSRPARPSAPKGKKQIYLGTFLGNSGAGKKEDENATSENEE